MTDESTDLQTQLTAIRGLVARLERRVRGQRAVEEAMVGITTGFLVVAVGVVLVNTGWMPAERVMTVVGLAAGLPVLTALFGWSRSLDPIDLARRLDDTHELYDRLSTALSLGRKPHLTDFERAQIRDAARFVDTVELERAAPWRRPREVGFAAAALAGLSAIYFLEPPDHRRALPPEPELRYDAVLDDASLAMERARLEALRRELARVDDPATKVLVEELDELLEQVDARTISAREFLEKLDQLEQTLDQDAAAEAHEALADRLKEAAEELKKSAAADLKKAPEPVRELVDSLQKKDFEAASEAMDDLAQKLDKGEMSAKDLERLAGLMEKFSDLIDPDDPALEKLIKDNQELVDKLSKLFDQEKLGDKEKRRLDEAKDRLKELQGKKSEQQRSEASRQLKTLQRKAKEMADDARKAAKEKEDERSSKKGGRDPKQPGGDSKKGEGEDQKPSFQNQAGRKAEQASRGFDEQAREQKRSEMRQQAREQLDEMREAMKRSASRRSSDPRAGQGQQGESRDQKGEQMKELLRRARGEQPDKDEPGSQGAQDPQANPDGQAPNPPEGAEPPLREGGNTPADGPRDPNRKGKPDGGGKGAGDRELGEETNLDGKRRDERLKGAENAKGASTAEVIEAAAEQGFANTAYRDVYTEYEDAVEEVMERDKVPPGYRFYVKRYFQLIQPQDE